MGDMPESKSEFNIAKDNKITHKERKKRKNNKNQKKKKKKKTKTMQSYLLY
jgi:hypothetical protein